MGSLRPGEKLYTISKKHFTFTCPICTSRSVISLYRPLGNEYALSLSNGRKTRKDTELYRITCKNLLCVDCQWDDFPDSFLQKNVVFIVKKDGQELKLQQQYYDLAENKFTAICPEGYEYWFREDPKENVLVILSPVE